MHLKTLTLLISTFLIGFAHAKEFSVLTWNVILLPSIVKTTFHDARLPLIAQKLSSSSYDFIFLQEVFSGDGYNTISKALKERGYYSTGKPYRGFFKPVNSGVVIFSKYPLSEIESIPLKGLIGADYFSSKAIVTAKAKVSETLSLQLVNTHLQAKENKKSVIVRKKQLIQLEEQFKKIDSSKKSPIIFAGDFNIDRNLEVESGLMHDFLVKYNFSTLSAAGDIKNTVDCSTNVLKSFIDPNCTYKKYLDYIYVSKPIKIKKLNILENKDNYIMKGKIKNLPLSDHFAIEAQIEI